MSAHEFGGDWTEDKLERVRKYLSAYMLIFERNERARLFFPTYVNAFAGTGYMVTQPHQKRKLQQEYKAFKKAGAAP